jgi:excisionase family DNA binding protein
METAQPPLLLNPRQLAELLQVSTGHVYRLVAQRRVPFVRLAGSSIRFKPEAIEAWIRGQEVLTVGQVLRGRRR